MEIKTILNPYQKKFLEEFKKEKRLVDLFYLTGGTALAEFYLRHRQSLDLDFFTERDFDLAVVTDFIQKTKEKMGFLESTLETLYDRKIFYLKNKRGELRVEFTKYPFKHLGKLEKMTGLWIDDLFDIAVNKLFALFDRNEPKDFIDLYFLLREFKLKQLVKGVKEKFGFKIEPLTLGSELIKVRKIAVAPKVLKKLTLEEMIAFFENEAKRLSKEIFL